MRKSSEGLKQSRPYYCTMTVAHIRDQSRPDAVEVMFLESARFYRLPREHANFDHVLKKLRDACSSNQPIKVQLPSLDSEIIEDVC